MEKVDPRILIIDDDRLSRERLIRYLRGDGYTSVAMAENGRQGLEMLQMQDFSLVLLDIKMPELDGISVLNLIKSDLHLRSIPVIMVSGVNEIESVAQCISLGAEDHLSKPFNATLLGARVKTCLERRRLREQEKAYLHQISSQKKRVDELLSVVFPPAAANELKATGKVKPRRFDNVALLFCDVVGFTQFCETHDPEEIVSYLETLFGKFEQIAREYKMEKIKTIGDSFMATAGLLEQNAAPLLSAVKCGLDMISSAREVESGWEVRVGVHSGSVVGGIVGNDRHQFDVWGDTVNTAARMASVAMPSTVTMTFEAWLQVEEHCKGRMVGTVPVKGKGSVQVVECHGFR